MFELALAMRAGRPDSLERRADLLGHAPAGRVINGDKQFQPSQAQAFERSPADTPNSSGSIPFSTAMGEPEGC
jgi:hypothetical protein